MKTNQILTVCPVMRKCNIQHRHGGNLLLRQEIECLKARPADLSHSVSAKAVEGDYYITLEHDMEKQHYITFMHMPSMTECF